MTSVESYLLRAICFAALLAHCPLQLRAADAGKATVDMELSSDVQDLVYLGPSQPILIRLHLSIDGKPFRQAWMSEVERSFAEFDSAGDGKITLAQFHQIWSRLSGSFAIAQPANDAPASEGASALTRQEVVDRLVKEVPPIKIEYGVAAGRGAGPALFPLLDLDRNGRLSADELKQAQELTKCRDFNDDQLITDQELVLELTNPELYGSKGQAEMPRGVGAICMISPATREMIGAALAHLYSKSDASDNDRSSRDFVVQENADGTVDPMQVDKFFQRRPDIELHIGLGRVSSARERSPRSGSSEIRVRKKIDGGYKLTSPDAEITLRRNNRNPNQQATDQIRVANYDADNNGYLEKNEVENVPFLAQAFDTIDQDSDKKIFSAELREFVERQAGGAGSRLLLEVFDQAQDLFGLLDSDQDGILGPRELRTAETVLATDDKDQDGQLGGSEIPQQISLVLSRGASNDTQMMVTRSRTRATPNRRARTGPVWFQKMDRNYDGDVSSDEFLGPRETFTRLDADSDRFIDADEAETAEK